MEDQDDLFDAPSDPSLLDGFVHVGFDEEFPIFSLERFDRLSPQRPGTLRHAAIAQKVLLVGTSGCRVLRVDMSATMDVEDIEVPKRKSDDGVRRVHMDPSGLHALVTTTSDETYHLALPSRKLRVLPKLRGMGVESVGWSPQRPDEAKTHALLLGTATGQLFEACVQDGRERYTKLVYELPERAAVCGVRVERFPSAGGGEEAARLLVFVATATRLYQFIGAPPYEALFALQTASGGRASAFAWLTQQGLHLGTLSFGAQRPGDSAIADQELLPLAARGRPVALALLQWHALVLLSDRLQALNRLSHEVVWEQALPAAQYGAPVGLVRDARSGAVWLATDTGLWRLLVVDEERDMWLLHVKRGSFEEALQLCRDEAQRDRVLAAHAEAYFAQGRYELAAERFAKSSRGFEGVALQFLGAGEAGALQRYLELKLDQLRPQEAASRLLIATWLTETYLERLNALEAEGEAGREGLERARDNFTHFLTDNRDVLHRETTYQVIASHGRMEEYAAYAAVLGDHDRLVAHHVERGEVREALRALLEQRDPGLYAKYAPDLIAADPAGTVNALIRAAGVVEPRDVLPALLRYDPARHNRPSDPVHHAVRYLEHCVAARRGGGGDPAVHNALLHMYAHLPDEAPLLRFLEAAAEAAPPPFDAEFALRLCERLGRRRACVQLQRALGHHERALEGALGEDLEAAKRLAGTARDPSEDPEATRELRRRLWLRIARHVAERTGDVPATVSVLRESGVLRVEEVLPFFGEAAHIGDVREEVLRALAASNARTAALRAAACEASGAAGELRGDVKELRGRVQIVPGEGRCGECRAPLLAREFYLFPCGHAFHTDCLLRRALPDLTRPEQLRLRPRPRPRPAPAGAPSPAPAAVPAVSLPGTPSTPGLLATAAGAGAATPTPGARGRKSGAGPAGLQTPEQRSRASSPRRNSASSSAAEAAAALAASLAGPSERGGTAWGGAGRTGRGRGAGGRSGLSTALSALSLGLVGGAQGGAKRGQSGEELARAERLREELGEYVARECVACGDCVIRAVDRPFLAPHDADELRRWEL
eukprot:tig00001486_g8918.t1